jgi:fucose 4-O-acetylase-like acetyltransferase
MSQTRETAPDAIKGICIVLMVYGHVTYIGSFTEVQGEANRLIYTFHMPLFLIVSGYFFKLRDDITHRIFNVLYRIGLPYVIFISLYLAGLILIQRVGIPTTNPPPGSLGEFLRAITLQPYGGYWFLHSLIVIQVSLHLSNAFARAIRQEGLPSIILVFLIISVFTAEFQLVGMSISGYFLSGYLLGQISANRLHPPKLWSIALMVIYFIVGQYGVIDYYRSFSAQAVVWCLLILFSLWSVAERWDRILGVKVLSWIGRNSLAVLVLHAIFVVGLKPFNSIFLAIDNTGILHSTSVTLITTVLCLFSVRVLDYLGMSRFIFGSTRIYSELEHADAIDNAA